MGIEHILDLPLSKSERGKILWNLSFSFKTTIALYQREKVKNISGERNCLTFLYFPKLDFFLSQKNIQSESTWKPVYRNRVSEHNQNDNFIL